MARKKKKGKDAELGSWDAEDADEAKEAEALKGTQMDKGYVDLKDTDKSSAGIETYDEDTGKLEGTIMLKDGNQTGELAIVRIVEQVKVEQDHYGDMTAAIGFNGKLEVENPSTVDRLWDIDITLANIESTNLKSDQIKIQELGTDESNNIDSREFAMSGDAKNLLLVKEYINTLTDADNILNINDLDNDLLKLQDVTAEAGDISDDEPADDADDEPTDDDMEDDGGEAVVDSGLESYGISIDKENTVYFAIVIRSLFDAPITNVKVVKTIPDEFSNVMVRDTTVGMADPEGNQIIWSIDELEPETTVMLKFTCDIMVSDIDPVRTGIIEVTYEAASSFAEGMSIGKFDAYTRNRFYVDTLEKDEAPGVWDCKLVFENSSEFILELFNADVYATEDEATKLVDIDPNDVPKLPAGAQWISAPWEFSSDDYPSFRKKLEFRVVPDFQTIVNGSIAIEDVELSIASIIGEMAYDITTVPTFKEKDVVTTLTLENNGSAPLNEVSFEQSTFNDQFQPPTAEEIALTIDGSEIELSEEAILIQEGILKIELKDLKESSTGMIQPNSKIEVTYPIHCINAQRDATFESVIVYYANTFPLSQELEFRPEPIPIIEAQHMRRKFRIGKEVMPIGSLGQYKIILTVENIGEMPLANLTLMDKVPDAFEYGEYSGDQPEITDEVGQDTLKWVIETLAEAEKLEIAYEITGKAGQAYSPSDAQLAL